MELQRTLLLIQQYATIRTLVRTATTIGFASLTYLLAYLLQAAESFLRN